MPGDCCECGACCFSESDSYVPVNATDIARLGDAQARAVVQIDGGSFLKMEDGHCAQLEHVEGDWVCGIYEIRPAACRQLKRGSPECLAERSLKRRTAIKASRRLFATLHAPDSTLRRS